MTDITGTKWGYIEFLGGSYIAHVNISDASPTKATMKIIYETTVIVTITMGDKTTECHIKKINLIIKKYRKQLKSTYKGDII